MKYLSLTLIIIKLMACKNDSVTQTGFEGKSLPEFTMQLADSVTILNTKSIPDDKPIVLFYFSPECPYCRTQIEDIVKNMNQLENIRFYVLTAYPFEQMKSFYNQYQLYKYSNVKVGIDNTKFFQQYYKISGVPYTNIYNNKKILHRVFNGVISSKQLKEIAEQ